LASEQTGINYRTIQAACARGDLIAHKSHPEKRTAAYLIDQADLDEWVARRGEQAS